MVKKFFAILLLFILLFNAVGVVILFQVQQYQVKKEIKERIKQDIPTEELTTIVLTKKNSHEFDWEHEREFCYKGIMYDVVKKQRKNESTTLLYCITDNEETILFAKLNEEIEKNMNARNNGENPLKNVFKLLSNIYLPVNQPSKHLGQSELKVPFTRYFFYYKTIFIAITNPPPELI